MHMTEYSKDLGDKICLAIYHGSSLVRVCKELTVTYQYVFKWLAENQEFADNYARAREAQADYHADEIIEIADTEADSNKARVRIDARKWVAGKMKPKKYGDATMVKHADADGEKLTLKGILSEINGSTADLPRDEEIPE